MQVLVCKFTDADGEKISSTFNHANASAISAQVKALINACINYGADVFDPIPAGIVSAQMITTTTTDIDVSE